MLSANGMRLKMAELNIRLKRYDEAIEMFEAVIQYYLIAKRCYWAISDYALKSMLCFMVNVNYDIKQIRAKFEDYCNRFQLIDWNLEKNFLTKLIDCVSDGDSVEFLKMIDEYSASKKLDLSVTAILSVIKQNMISVN